MVTFGAGFHDPFPAWLATTLTVPAPVNVSVEPPEMDAGPDPTANETASPLDAVADSATVFVATCAPIAGKLIVCPCGPATVVTFVTEE